MPRTVGLIRGWRPLLGVALAGLMRLWVKTWRLRLTGEGLATLNDGAPLVFAFWHGQQLALLAVRARRRRSPTGIRGLTTLVSWSADGVLQASAMLRLGIGVVRGSSSRGAVTGLRGMVKAVQQGSDAAFAVDGPRGPRGRAKSGALLVAARSGTRVVPVGAAARRSLVLRRAWDAFEIPWPFTRVSIVVGAALPAGAHDADVLATAIDAAHERATRALDESGEGHSNALPSPAAGTYRDVDGSASDDRRTLGG